MHGLQKLAAIMKAGQTTKPFQVTLVVKMALLGLLIFASVALGLTYHAQASETSLAQPSQEIRENTLAPKTSIVEEGVPLAVLDFTTSTTSLGSQGQNSSYDEGSPSVAGPSQNVTNQNEYVSVRGYSAFNHFSLALKATLAAVIVILVGCGAFYLYRRHRA